MTTPITVEQGQPGAPIEVTLSSVGERGPQGDAGPANTLAIGTVEGGAAAAATITGTAPNQTLNLTLPAGPQGVQGVQGEVGPAGPTGPVGATGPAGPGNTLAIGAVTTGDPGSGAAASITGTSPSQTLDLTIPRGDVGATGATGPQGARGAPGAGNDTIWKLKAAAQTVENQATLQADADLQFEAAANSTYLVTMAWRFEETGAGRSTWSLGLPAGATVTQALHQFAGPDDYKPEYHLPLALNLPELTLPFTAEAGKSNDGVNTLMAVVKTDATAGTVAFQFCQTDAAAAQTAAVGAASWMRAELVIPDPAAASGPTVGVNVESVSANVTLTAASKRYQFLEPSSSLDVTLPAAAAGIEGLSFVVKNEDATYYNTLTVKDAAGATVTALYSQSAAEVVCTGSGWKFVTLGGGGY